ncbi:MAG: flagellar biosynthesis protein FlhF [Myxococcota bacterium]
MRAALAKVKADLGPDAIILNSRTVGGIFGGGEVELTAVVDEVAEVSSAAAATAAAKATIAAPMPPTPSVDPKRTMDLGQANIKTQLAPLYDEIRALRAELSANQRPEPVRHELKEMKRFLGQLLTVEPDRGLTSRMLRAADVDPDLIEILVEETHARLRSFSSVKDITPDQERAGLAEVIGLRLKAPLEDPGPRVKMLVGPTGVGKTTTVAKLAAQAALMEGKRVGIITHDTYRVGAVEQLRRYSELMRVPMRVASNRETFLRALDQFRGADLVLVDTAGRRPNDDRAVYALKRLIAGTQVECHLVVSATSRSIELRTIVERYQPLEAKSVIVTKLDEASVFGAVLNVSMRGELPVSYTTFGQRVPEDIERANTRELALRVINPVYDALNYDGPTSAAGGLR